ncbi:MAG: flagellar hook-basal body complex protein FliE [Proteobacteria bacterium]|nr:flagellar hook-basal body complex protein FliE [Pseudomonadota bacterium]
MRIDALPGVSAPTRPIEHSLQPAKDGFSDALSRSVSSLTELQAAADRAAESIATGDLAHLHEAVIAVQEASLALDLVVAVRNHTVEGIQELLRTQV